MEWWLPLGLYGNLWLMEGSKYCYIFQSKQGFKKQKNKVLKKLNKTVYSHWKYTCYEKTMDSPGDAGIKNPPTNAGRCGFGPWVRKISWRRKWHPTPVFLLGKFQGQRSLVSDSPWGHKESDLTQQWSTHAHTSKLHFVCLQTQFQGSLWHKVFLFIPVKHVRW